MEVTPRHLFMTEIIIELNYSHVLMHLAGYTWDEDVKTSVTRKEKSKGICMEGYPEKYNFFTIPPH